jgi:hypothetical protein
MGRFRNQNDADDMRMAGVGLLRALYGPLEWRAHCDLGETMAQLFPS